MRNIEETNSVVKNLKEIALNAGIKNIKMRGLCMYAAEIIEQFQEENERLKAERDKAVRNET